MPELIDPTPRVHRSFLAAMDEFADEGRRGDQSMIGRELATEAPGWATEDGFARYIDVIMADRREDAARAPLYVPCTHLWWVEGDEYLGRVGIRHRLTPLLLEIGGHIGYDVRRSARRLGHASAMLRAALPIAASLGITSALVTCDLDNTASRKVIEGGGGVLEDEREGKLRYWVPTAGAVSAAAS